LKRSSNRFVIVILSLAVVVAVILSIMTYLSATSAPLPNLAGIIAAPFRSAAAAVSGTVKGWADYFTEFDALKEENRQLKLQIAKMEEDVRQATFDREENVHLRQVAELREKRRDLHLESVRVLVQDNSNWYSQLTVNKGTDQDIEVGDCVITEEGYLLGVVTETGLNWATVRTILDSDSSIGALVFRNSSSAIAQGDFSLMSNGRMALTYLGTEPDVVAGDLIVTSGLGGYLPSQLVIGYVEEVRTGDNGLSQYAVLRPEMSLDGLTEIFVVTSFDIVD